MLREERTVATQELLLAEPIPPGFHLSASESLTLEVNLVHVLNGRMWRPRGGVQDKEDKLKADLQS